MTKALFQTLENATAAKPRSGALSKLCGRSAVAPRERSYGGTSQTAQLALFSWLAAAAIGGKSFGEWSPSIRSLFSWRAPPKTEDEKTGRTNPAAIAAAGA